MAVIGRGAVTNFANQGMPAAHIDAFCRVATARNEVIIVRPVERICRTLLEEDYPTKGFHVKGKSSNWGPQAGFVCVDQSLSKLAGRAEDVKKFNIQTASCLSSGDATEAQLVISEARITELKEMGLLTRVRRDPRDARNWVFEALPGAGGTVHIFEAVRVENERYAIFVSPSAMKRTPLMVLADAKKRPLTADYDLLAVCPRWEHLSLGTADRMQVGNVSHKVVEARVDRYARQPVHARTASGAPNAALAGSIAALRAGAQPAAFYAKEDTHLGNITPRINACRHALNAAIARGPGLDTVHHNADSGSPATDMSANFPCTAFNPQAFAHWQDACMLESVGELRQYFQDLLNLGYYVPRNPLWGDLTALRADRFRQAQAALAQKIRG